MIVMFERRKALKLSQKQLSKKCETTRHRISEIETGRFHPHPHEIEKIAEALECCPHELIFRPQPPRKVLPEGTHEMVARFRHKATFRPKGERSGQSRLAGAWVKYSMNMKDLEPLLQDAPNRQFVDDAYLGSSLELVGWLEKILRDGARPAEASPLYIGFDKHPVVCPQTKRSVGHIPVPALVTEGYIVILQVSMLTPTLYTVDGLGCTFHNGQRFHFAVEFDGPAKPPPDPRRTKAIGIPILRFTEDEILAGVTISAKLEAYFASRTR